MLAAAPQLVSQRDREVTRSMINWLYFNFSCAVNPEQMHKGIAFRFTSCCSSRLAASCFLPRMRTRCQVPCPVAAVASIKAMPSQEHNHNSWKKACSDMNGETSLAISDGNNPYVTPTPCLRGQTALTATRRGWLRTRIL